LGSFEGCGAAHKRPGFLSNERRKHDGPKKASRWTSLLGSAKLGVSLLRCNGASQCFEREVLN